MKAKIRKRQPSLTTQEQHLIEQATKDVSRDIGSLKKWCKSQAQGWDSFSLFCWDKDDIELCTATARKLIPEAMTAVITKTALPELEAELKTLEAKLE